ncbi:MULTISPECIES: aldo/keto reductase [unclassified Paenibacillus]|uniref:aldo/keto reductase n=1 Tax=unclassified Paenibacillus TaxID=185978 RepID=UPI000953C337|nr:MULTISPECIES: aldo/keto reductase [unclassified Paenibacillus]ASS67956.1 aldo/keto reductase [Paenibacillus sp. RUD330]SIR42860.1 Predicted oxidoreductase [Paenibacillus sp. RU4X]SIR52950.1 Predicted oxidoreductase [Paenibacillus sp. RU4T]
MKYRRLGKTELNVSVVGIGTWQFGGEWGMDFAQDEVDAILDKGAELGINLIDTAECYGDHLSEAFIGNYIGRRRREDWIIATKFGHHFHERFKRTDVFSGDDVVRQLDASLKALQTDYVDLYQFHSGPDAAFDSDGLWTALDKQAQAGKIRHLGTSIGSNDNLHQTAASSKVGSQAIQVVYNRLDRKPEERVFPSCLEQDLGVLARVPLASGFLSGKYKPGTEFGETDVRHRQDAEQVRQRLEEVRRIAEEEVPEGVHMAAWALAWCLRHPAVTSVIPGCKNPEQVQGNADAVKLVTEPHPQDVPNIGR